MKITESISILMMMKVMILVILQKSWFLLNHAVCIVTQTNFGSIKLGHWSPPNENNIVFLPLEFNRLGQFLKLCLST